MRGPTRICVAPGGRVIAVTDPAGDRVLVVTTEGMILAEHAVIGPAGVRFGRAEELVVCQPGLGRVVALTPDGRSRVIVTGLARPVDVAVAADGTAFVADAGAHAIHVVRSDGTASVHAGHGRGLADGPRGTGQLDGPTAIMLGVQGAFVTEAGSHTLRIVDERGGIATLVGRGRPGAADGAPTTARLRAPSGVVPAPDGTSVYVSDTGNDRLRFWSGVDGELSTLPVDGLRQPGGIDVLPDGRLVVADTGNDRVVLVDLANSVLATVLG